MAQDKPDYVYHGPEEYQSVLGRYFVTKGTEVVFRLTSGKGYDRYQLAAIGVPQIKAAKMLHLVCRRLSIATSAQLAVRIGELATLRGCGHAVFYTALAVLRSEGHDQRALNSYADVAVSRVHHNPAKKDWEPTPVTLTTVKTRSQKSKKKTKPRKGAPQ